MIENNVELKAIVRDMDQARMRAEELGFIFHGLDTQRDVYFTTRAGRFKLRFSELSGSYLIPYLRPEDRSVRESRYYRIPVDDPDAFEGLMGEILGIANTVEKLREVYIRDHIRLHLDQVQDLGNFLEFEAVLTGTKIRREEAVKELEELCREFGLGEGDLIRASYYDLREQNDS